jgi:DNA-binding NarL/FixJ family response regulator
VNAADVARPEAAMPPLPRADIEILRLLADGLTTDAVARRVGLSERTVRRRLRTMADSVGVATTMELVVYAVRAGLI